MKYTGDTRQHVVNMYILTFQIFKMYEVSTLLQYNLSSIDNVTSSVAVNATSSHVYTGTPFESTTEADIRHHRMYTAYNTIVAVNSALITFSLGCGINHRDIVGHMKKPVGPLIGIMCQSVLMPLFCFAYSHLLRLEASLAVGMITIGSCPGGALSNIFTYWSRGDLSLR